MSVGSHDPARPATPDPDAPSRPPRLRRLTAYAGFVRWLLRDSLWHFKGVTAGVLVTGLLAVAASGTALLLALRYAQVLESGDVFDVLGRSYDARTSKVLLTGFAVSVSGLLLLSAGLTYVSRRATISLRIRYELLCSERVLAVLASTVRATRPDDQHLTDVRLATTVGRRDARYCGRVLFYVVQAVVPSLTFVAALVVMLVLEAPLTSLLLVLIAVGLVFLSRVNVAAAHASWEVERSGPKAAAEYRETLSWVRGSTAVPTSRTWFEDSVLHAPGTTRFLTAYRTRLQATESARLVSNLLFAACFLLILLRFGSEIIAEGTGFGRLVVYLVVLRTALVSFRTMASAVTAVNRFYPQLRRYRSFVTARPDTPSPAAGPGVVVPVTADPALAPCPSTVSLRPGDRAGMLAVAGPDRFTASVLAECLHGPEDPGRHAVTWATSDYVLLHGRPPRESFGSPSDDEVDALLAMTDGTVLGEELRLLLPLLDDASGPRPVTSSALRFLLSWTAVAHSDARLVLLEERGLRTLPTHVRRQALARLDDRIVLVVYAARTTAPGDYDEQVVLVVDGDRTIGAGTPQWLVQHREIADRLLLAALRRALPAVDGAADDDSEDDEL